MSAVTTRRVETPADRRAFVDLLWTLYKDDPHWVPPLRYEALDLIAGKPDKNPWYGHGTAAFWLAEQGGRVVGRISAQDDPLLKQTQGADLGHFGMFECVDDQSVADALFAAAHGWLRERGISRAQGPFSISIWDEVGLQTLGFEYDPTVLMAHGLPYYEKLVTAAGYTSIKDIHAWGLRIDKPFPERVNRIVEMGAKNPRVTIRTLKASQYDGEIQTVLGILNDAWSSNWGFVPLTPEEIAFAAKKFKPIVFEDLVYIAEVDGEAVGFMIAVPDMNEAIKPLNGRLLPFGWVPMLIQLKRPRAFRIRVPLMGIVKKHQGTRLASMLAFMMIEYTRRSAVKHFRSSEAEIGWILEDNGPMRGIAEVIDSRITSTYRIYERGL